MDRDIEQAGDYAAPIREHHDRAAAMTWRRASMCTAENGCVEVATATGVNAAYAGGVLVRASNLPRMRLWFTDAEWAAFLAGVKAGEFDE